MITRTQMLELGFSPDAIKYRITTGRLHPVRRGTYAVGRPQLTREGHWMAAVLSCGPDALLSHVSAAALWGIVGEPRDSRPVDVLVPDGVSRAQPGVRLHRRRGLTVRDVTRRRGIPATTPLGTIVDLAVDAEPSRIERMINEADKLGLLRADELAARVAELPARPGVAPLRRVLERHAFTITDTVLEQHFLPIARRAGLTPPRTQQSVNGFRVDFYWPELALVVETDGLRYHRTAAQQTADRLRDQTHTASGLTTLRFTRWQVVFEPGHVRATLAAVAARLRSAR